VVHKLRPAVQVVRPAGRDELPSATPYRSQHTYRTVTRRVA